MGIIRTVKFDVTSLDDASAVAILLQGVSSLSTAAYMGEIDGTYGQDETSGGKLLLRLL